MLARLVRFPVVPRVRYLVGFRCSSCSFSHAFTVPTIYTPFVSSAASFSTFSYSSSSSVLACASALPAPTPPKWCFSPFSPLPIFKIEYPSLPRGQFWMPKKYVSDEELVDALYELSQISDKTEGDGNVIDGHYLGFLLQRIHGISAKLKAQDISKLLHTCWVLQIVDFSFWRLLCQLAQNMHESFSIEEMIAIVGMSDDRRIINGMFVNSLLNTCRKRISGFSLRNISTLLLVLGKLGIQHHSVLTETLCMEALKKFRQAESSNDSRRSSAMSEIETDISNILEGMQGFDAPNEELALEIGRKILLFDKPEENCHLLVLAMNAIFKIEQYQLQTQETLQQKPYHQNEQVADQHWRQQQQQQLEKQAEEQRQHQQQQFLQPKLHTRQKLRERYARNESILFRLYEALFANSSWKLSLKNNDYVKLFEFLPVFSITTSEKEMRYEQLTEEMLRDNKLSRFSGRSLVFLLYAIAKLNANYAGRDEIISRACEELTLQLPYLINWQYHILLRACEDLQDEVRNYDNFLIALCSHGQTLLPSFDHLGIADTLLALSMLGITDQFFRDLCDQVYVMTSSFTPLTISRCLYALSVFGMNTKENEKEGELIERLCQQILYLADRFDASEIHRILSALNNLHYKNMNLIATLCARLSLHEADEKTLSSPTQVAATLFSLAKLGVHDKELVSILRKKVTAMSFDAGPVYRVLYALSVFKEEDYALLEKLYKNARMFPLLLRNVACKLLQVLSSFPYVDRVLVDSLCEQVMSNEHVTAVDILLVLEALRRMQIYNRELASFFCDKLVDKVFLLGFYEIASILRSLSLFNVFRLDLVTAMCERLILLTSSDSSSSSSSNSSSDSSESSSRNDTRLPFDVRSNSGDSLLPSDLRSNSSDTRLPFDVRSHDSHTCFDDTIDGTEGSEGASRLIRPALDISLSVSSSGNDRRSNSSIEQNDENFSIQLTHVLGALRRFGERACELEKKVRTHFAQQSHSFSCTKFGVLIKSCFEDKQKVAKLCQEAKENIAFFSQAEIFSAIRALSDCKVQDQELVFALCEKVLDMISKSEHNIFGDQICLVFYVIASYKFFVYHAFLLKWFGIAKKQVSSFNVVDTGHLLSSLGRIPYFDKELVKALCNQMCLFTLSPKECSVILHALSQLLVYEESMVENLCEHIRKADAKDFSARMITDILVALSRFALIDVKILKQLCGEIPRKISHFRLHDIILCTHALATLEEYDFDVFHCFLTSPQVSNPSAKSSVPEGYQCNQFLRLARPEWGLLLPQKLTKPPKIVLKQSLREVDDVLKELSISYKRNFEHRGLIIPFAIPARGIALHIGAFEDTFRGIERRVGSVWAQHRLLGKIGWKAVFISFRAWNQVQRNLKARFLRGRLGLNFRQRLGLKFRPRLGHG